MRTSFTSAQVQNMIRNTDTANAILAVDADDNRGPYLTPKFSRDRKPRSYIMASTDGELQSEIMEFDASLD